MSPQCPEIHFTWVFPLLQFKGGGGFPFFLIVQTTRMYFS